MGNRQFTSAEIGEMIACEKQIVDAPRSEMREERGFRRNQCSLKSTDGRFRFDVFIRVNSAFPENFSVGLDFLDDDGSRTSLLRCNGPHEGTETNSSHSIGNHAGFHIHLATAENIADGLDPVRGAERTKEYGSLDEAISYFMKRCNVIDAFKHFKDLREPRLFPQ
jgi:hypothetical protein